MGCSPAPRRLGSPGPRRRMWWETGSPFGHLHGLFGPREGPRWSLLFQKVSSRNRSSTFLRTPLALGKLSVFSRMPSGGGQGGVLGLLGVAGGPKDQNGLASPGLGVGRLALPPWLFLWEACALVVEALGPLPTLSKKGKTPKTARSHPIAFLVRFQKMLRVFPD